MTSTSIENNSNKILFILKHSPYGSLKAQESLDMLLMAAAYEMKVSVLFFSEGLFQLINDQNPADSSIDRQNILKTLGVLDVYGVENQYIHAEFYDEMSLSGKLDENQKELIHGEHIAGLLNQFQFVIAI